MCVVCVWEGGGGGWGCSVALTVATRQSSFRPERDLISHLMIRILWENSLNEWTECLNMPLAALNVSPLVAPCRASYDSTEQCLSTSMTKQADVPCYATWQDRRKKCNSWILSVNSVGAENLQART